MCCIKIGSGGAFDAKSLLSSASNPEISSTNSPEYERRFSHQPLRHFKTPSCLPDLLTHENNPYLVSQDPSNSCLGLHNSPLSPPALASHGLKSTQTQTSFSGFHLVGSRRSSYEVENNSESSVVGHNQKKKSSKKKSFVIQESPTIQNESGPNDSIIIQVKTTVVTQIPLVYSAKSKKAQHFNETYQSAQQMPMSNRRDKEHFGFRSNRLSQVYHTRPQPRVHRRMHSSDDIINENQLCRSYQNLPLADKRHKSTDFWNEQIHKNGVCHRFNSCPRQNIAFESHLGNTSYTWNSNLHKVVQSDYRRPHESISRRNSVPVFLKGYTTPQNHPHKLERVVRRAFSSVPKGAPLTMAPVALERFQGDSLKRSLTERNSLHSMNQMLRLPVYRFYGGASSQVSSEGTTQNGKSNIISKAFKKVGKMCKRDKTQRHRNRMRTLAEERHSDATIRASHNTSAASMNRNFERFGENSVGLLIPCPSYEQLNTAHNGSFSSFPQRRSLSLHSFPQNNPLACSNLEPDLGGCNVNNYLYNTSHIYTSPTNTLPSCSGGNNLGKSRFLANKQVTFW